jgi:hypothetical protein
MRELVQLGILVFNVSDVKRDIFSSSISAGDVAIDALDI